MSGGAHTADAPDGGALLAWKQILRLGNVFTAASNVIAGFLIVRGEWSPGALLAPLVAASMLLYAAGMVLNDGFDAALDARERPERPIPSGRIRRTTALAVGWILLGAGLTLALGASLAHGLAAPIIVGACLAMTIVLYDAGLKSTPAGPWAMGWCRTLNVLLGASAAAQLGQHPVAWAYAAGIGLYTVALTYVARREVHDSPQRAQHIRRTVKRMILGFIVIDAMAATWAAGWASGLAVLALLIPSLIGARRAPMT
jgi:4-hydroxybenzoate polyprenyltransferase